MPTTAATLRPKTGNSLFGYTVTPKIRPSRPPKPVRPSPVYKVAPVTEAPRIHAQARSSPSPSFISRSTTTLSTSPPRRYPTFKFSKIAATTTSNPVAPSTTTTTFYDPFTYQHEPEVVDLTKKRQLLQGLDKLRGGNVTPSFSDRPQVIQIERKPSPEMTVPVMVSGTTTTESSSAEYESL